MTTELPEKPENREELYLAKIAGENVEIPAEPMSREEQYLAYIAENGGGGGGTSNFNQLTNRPKYNNADMTGSTNIPEVKTYTDFVGTDGTATGTAGLVPAPATTDAGKFLKADGTWATAGGDSAIHTLTAADFNYAYDEGGELESVALWLLPNGIYRSNPDPNAGVDVWTCIQEGDLMSAAPGIYVVDWQGGGEPVNIGLFGCYGTETYTVDRETGEIQ